MAQRSRGERVLGPYAIGKQWRVVVVGRGGERDSRFYPSEEKARQVIRAVRREFARSGDKTVQEGLDAYERYLLDDKGNKPGSVEDTLYRLGAFFPDGEVLLRDLDAKTCSGYYDALRTRKTRLGRTFSVDSHRNILAETKSFLRWCAVKKKWLARNPLEDVEGVGKRKHGKAQLRVDEARQWLVKAVALADRGEAGAVAALMALVMGMRANEIVSRVTRDRRQREAALDTGLEDGGGAEDAAGAGAAPADAQRARPGEGSRGEALRASLAGLGPEVGEAHLRSGRGAEGDRARDARPAFDAGGGERCVRSRCRGLARSRVEHHDDPELREAGGGLRRAAASRDDRAGGWSTRLLNDQKFETIGPRIVSNRLSRRKK
jgi:hypothetical protein